MAQQITQFNIRVYALLFNSENQILLSDEYVLDSFMTKFPGGGLIPGEGPEDCIKRECLEEFGQEIEIVRHFYTTGFFQRAKYYPEHQLISIYYQVKLKGSPAFKISEKAFDFKGKINGSQSFRWCSIDHLEAGDFTFPIDRHVISMLKQESNLL